MRRMLIAMVVIALASGAAGAADMKLGVKAGLNLASWSGDDTSFFTIENERKTAFGGGIWFNYSFNDVIGVQPELFFMGKGTKWESGGNELLANFNYFDINLLAKAYLPLEGSLHPFVAVGPQIAFLSSAKLEADGEEMDVKDSFKSTSLGLVAGIGLDYVFDTNCISLDLRYTIDMGTISDNDDVDIKNTGLQIIAGYGYEF